MNRTLLTCLFALIAAATPVARVLAQGNVVQHIEAGPINVEMQISRESMNVAETLEFTLEVTTQPSVIVDLPRPGEKLGGFSVSAVSDDPSVSVAGTSTPQTRLTRHITLEPFLPGDYTVPEMEIRWHRIGTGESGVAKTAPQTIKVVSLLPDAAQNPRADLKAMDPGTIRGKYTPPLASSWRPLLVGVGVAGAAVTWLAGWAAVTVRRRRGHRDPVAALLAAVQAGDEAPALDSAAFSQKLGRTIRAGLADRVDTRAASMLAAELPERLPRGTFFSEPLALDCARLLTVLDDASYSGRPVPAEERARLRAEALGILQALIAMPRPAEVTR